MRTLAIIPALSLLLGLGALAFDMPSDDDIDVNVDTVEDVLIDDALIEGTSLEDGVAEGEPLEPEEPIEPNEADFVPFSTTALDIDSVDVGVDGENPSTASEEVGIVAAAGTVHNVSNESELNAAVAVLADGDVINIQASFSSEFAIGFTGNAIELRLNGNTLSIWFIYMFEGTMNVVGPGTLITNSDIWLESRSTLTNNGAVINTNGGISIDDNSKATITSVTGYVSASNSSTLTITGNVNGQVLAHTKSNIAVNGNVTAGGNLMSSAAVYAYESTVTINGNVTSTVADGAGVQVSSYPVYNSSTVTVNGTITADLYILFGNDYDSDFHDRTPDEFDSIVTINGIDYLQYTSAPFNSTVLVRASIMGNNSIPIPFTQDGTTVTLNIDDSVATALIDSAQGGVIQIDISSLAGATVASIPTSFFSQVDDANLGVKLDLPQGTITFSASALSTLAAQTGDSIEISLYTPDTTDLPAAQQNAINTNDAVFRITATSSDGTPITNFGGGTLTITVLYDGPTPAVVWYLNDAGALSFISNGSYNAINKTVTFTTNHLSIYLIRQGSQQGGQPWQGGTQVAGERTAAPQTGDYRSILLPIAFIVFGIIGLTGWVIYNKKLEKAEKL